MESLTAKCLIYPVPQTTMLFVWKKDARKWCTKGTMHVLYPGPLQITRKSWPLGGTGRLCPLLTTCLLMYIPHAYQPQVQPQSPPHAGDPWPSDRGLPRAWWSWGCFSIWWHLPAVSVSSVSVEGPVHGNAGVFEWPYWSLCQRVLSQVQLQETVPGLVKTSQILSLTWAVSGFPLLSFVVA
jgi:hypothetical protein